MAFVAKMRNRIIGLLIIVTLIIIILPALMNSKGRSGRQNGELIAISHEGAITDEDGQLVAAQEPDYATLLDPVDDLGGEDEAAVTPAPPAATVPEAPASVGRAAAAAAETLTAPAAPPARHAASRPAETLNASSVPRTQVAAGRGSFTVQIGAFEDAANADKLVGRLQSRGIAAEVRRARVGNRDMYRVCAGRAGSRTELEGLMRRIEQAINVQGRIVEL